MEEKKVPWYLSTQSIVVAVLILGPFALPMLWLNPKYKLFWKIFWTSVILAITWATFVYTGALLDLLQQKLSEFNANNRV